MMVQHIFPKPCKAHCGVLAVSSSVYVQSLSCVRGRQTAIPWYVDCGSFVAGLCSWLDCVSIHRTAIASFTSP